MLPTLARRVAMNAGHGGFTPAGGMGKWSAPAMRAAMRQKISAPVMSSAITAAVSVVATGVAITGIALSMDNEEALAKYAVPGDEYWVSFCLC